MSRVQKVKPSQIRAGKADFPLIGMPLAAPQVPTTSPKRRSGDFLVKFTEEELKNKLTTEQYQCTQNAGTEKAFSGGYCRNQQDGTYKCVVCESDLFSSGTKFDSGSGWPSFSDVMEKDKVKLVADNSMMAARTEVLCAICGAHLGHVFNDGPKESTGKRYCVNSASLSFNEQNKK